MPKIEEIQTGGAGGGAGAKKSAEDYRGSYVYKAITDRDTLKMLANLPVFTPSSKQGVTFSMEELAALGFTGDTLGAVMQAMNRCFDTIEIPYSAGTINRGGVQKVKVIRYGNEFDFTKYATTRSGRPAKDKEGNVTGIVDHEDSPPGLVAALHEWLAEIAEDELMQDVILNLGLDRKMSELNLIDVQEEEEVEETEK